MAHIIAPRVLLEAAHAHVFDHARPPRADDGPRRGIGGHRGSPELKVAGPSMLRIGCPDRHALLLTPPKTHRPSRVPSRASGFVLRRDRALRHGTGEGRQSTRLR